MKTHFTLICLISGLLFCFVSCKPSDGQKKRRIVASKGLPSELLLVVDKQVLQSDLSDSLKELTQGPVPALMQHEEFFRVLRIPSSAYTQKYTTMHSKLFVNLDPSLGKAMLGVAYNVVARPQIELTVAAPTLSSLRSFISQNATVIRNYISDFQLDMRSNGLRRKYNSKVDSLLKQTLGYSIFVPNELQYVKQGTQFLWAGTNLNEKDLNVVVYSFPWTGENVFCADFFTAKRDSVMKINIPGSSEEQWMQTTRFEGVPVLQSCVIGHAGKRVYKVNGLWEMRNGAFGGPFVSYVQVDSVAAEVVVSEGFVYSPSTEKRELLRNVEASLRTLKKVKSYD